MIAPTFRPRPRSTVLPERIRVAHVAETMDLGGLEKLLVEFARHADRDRFDLRFVTLGARGDLAGEVEALGCPVHALNLPAGLRPRAVVRLLRLFRAERVDVVHTHSEGPLLYATLAARLAGVARVIHTRHHGPDLGSSRKALAAMALVSRAVDRVVCVADDGARRSLAEGVPAGKLMTVHNGIDLARFAYNGPTPGGPAVIVARLIPEKDHATLLRAMALAAREEPEFRLEIAGDGPCLAASKALVGELGLGDCVRFLGRVDDVPALLGRAGLLVLSSWLEGVSLTLLEAMARGLPVVATRVIGSEEVVVEGETGLLVRPRDAGALEVALGSLLADPQRRAELARTGRRRFVRGFTSARMTTDTVAVYEQVLSAARVSA